VSDIYGFVLDTNKGPLGDGEVMVSGLAVGGRFTIDRYDSEGNYLETWYAKNIIPNAVLNDILNVYFNQSSQSTAFYIGMVDNSGFSAFAATDTMASHSGWSENVATSNPSRPAWTPGSASSQSISNPSPATITMNATATIKGFFMTTSNTLNGTSGNLDCTAALGSPQSCNSGDVLKITYAINGTTS
jgi:hypothetical protein